MGCAQVLVPSGCAADQPDLLRDAQAAYRRQRYQEVIALASRAIERDERSLEVYRLRAAASEALGRFDAAIADLNRCVGLQSDAAGVYQARGVAHFKAGHVRQSISDFDRFLEFHPEREPHHWQRGISYYYAEEYQKGVRQFELHKTVNAQDVENAIWHYLCKGRVDGTERARAALIEITSDRRPWAMSVYRMYRGELAPKEVLAHAEQISQSEADRRNNMFYAHLYVGLYHEAAGRTGEARKHIEIAVVEFPSSHYMGDVARVHLQLRNGRKRSER
jgi:lipoprotein NlpI